MTKQAMGNEKNTKIVGCCCASRGRGESEAEKPIVNNADSPLQYISIKGASCEGCVEKIEKALLPVAGVEAVQMDLAHGLVKASGNVETNRLVLDLETLGFSAALSRMIKE